MSSLPGPLRGLLAGVVLVPLPGLVIADDVPSSRIDLPVNRVVASYPPYADFCRRQPTECRLGGPGVVAHSVELMKALQAVSRAVNREVSFSRDVDNHGVEDYWKLPASGYGDCEDLALEKRSRLVRRGYPRGAMRLAFVHDRENMTSHCVLTVETTAGTFLLDSYTDDVRRWWKTPYNFEARERQDGRWERFDQSHWRYDDPHPVRP